MITEQDQNYPLTFWVKIYFNKICILIAFTFFFVSCSGYSPLVIHNRTIHLGMFKFERQKPHPEVEYFSLEGAGLVVGPLHIGIGYYNNQQATFLLDKDISAITPIAEVYVGNNAIIRAKTFVNERGNYASK